MLLDRLVSHIEPNAVVDRKFRQNVPFVLHVKAVEPTGQTATLPDGLRPTGLHASVIDRHHGRVGIKGCAFALGQEPTADRVHLVDAPASVRLYTGGEVRSVGDLRNTVEQKVPKRVRGEVQVVIVAKQRDLPVELIEMLLIGQNSEIGGFVPILVQYCAVERTDTVHADPKRRYLPGGVGDLKLAVIGSGDKAEPGILIEDPRDMNEAVKLICGVMKWRCSWTPDCRFPLSLCR